eukprot:GHVR01152362.1.p1 GENE.GHVR01152362.1~~GHVR01152362.1.p1  ORF type:complete len:219 (-),score=37.87 GHVR01152362.1:66-722(-)
MSWNLSSVHNDDRINANYLKCIVCCKISIDMYIVKCNSGHLICSLCKLLIIDNKCPLCLYQIRYNNITTNAPESIINIIKNIRILCPNIDCTYYIKLDNILKHRNEECPYEYIECIHCGDNIRRGFISTHYCVFFTIEGIRRKLSDMNNCIPHTVTLDRMKELLTHAKEESYRANQRATIAEKDKEEIGNKYINIHEFLHKATMYISDHIRSHHTPTS